MSSNEQPFGPWVEAMEKVGAVSPRTHRPSWTQLAAKADLSVSAVTNMVNGKTRARPDTVQKVAQALRVRPEVVSGWLGTDRPVGGPWEPPRESSLLFPHERDALDDLIRAMARGRAKESDGDGNAAPTKPEPEGSAQVTPLYPTPPTEVLDQEAALHGEPAHGPDTTTGEGDQSPAGDWDPS